MTQRDKLGRLKKNILGRRLNKHKGPGAGVSVACSEKERRAVWLGHREQARAARVKKERWERADHLGLDRLW